ncbi:MAG: ZIP family metal transporter [Planctomycetaceae bacterium]
MTLPVAAIDAPGPAASLTAYLLVIAAAALAGGSSLALVALGHRRMQVLLSFTGGVMLGVGLLHLLPHGHYELGGDVETTMGWVLGGFTVMFLLERAFHGHAHHAADGSHDAGCRHDHGPAGGAAATGRWSWVGALIGLSLHSLADGAALAAAVEAGGPDGGGLVGFATFLAIAVHKPIDACVIATLLIGAGAPAARRRWVNIGYALVVPLGAIAYLASLRWFGGGHEIITGASLAAAGGAFICIAAADLLPEVEFHSHDRLLLSVALFLGLGVAVGITAVERASPAHAAHAAGDHPHRH